MLFHGVRNRKYYDVAVLVVLVVAVDIVNTSNFNISNIVLSSKLSISMVPSYASTFYPVMEVFQSLYFVTAITLSSPFCWLKLYVVQSFH